EGDVAPPAPCYGCDWWSNWGLDTAGAPRKLSRLASGIPAPGRRIMTKGAAVIGRRSTRPLRPARRRTTIWATIAMAMTLPVAAGAPMASAEPRPDLAELTPTIAANGSISTFGGCNSGIPFLIRSCTEAETITTGYPMQLKLRPEGHHIVILGYGLQENGALRAELIRRLTSARDMADTYPETTLIVTGGAPRNGVTEASVMKEWLVDNGIDED